MMEFIYSFVPFSSILLPLRLHKIEWGYLQYFDDTYNFVEFPNMGTLFPLTFKHFRELLTHQGLNVYEPVGQILKAATLDIVGQDNVHGLHLVSLAFHTLNALLLGVWLHRFCSNKSCVARLDAVVCTCLLWWISPVGHEVIGWLSAQNYVWSLTFGLCAAISIEVNSSAWTTVALYGLAVWCKAPALSILILLCARKFDLQHHNCFKSVVGLTVVAVLSAFVIHRFNIDSEQQYPETSHVSYALGAILRASMTCVNFIQRMVMPGDLRAHYNFHQQHLYHLLDPDQTCGVEGGVCAGPQPTVVLSVAYMIAATCFFARYWRSSELSVLSYSWWTFLACWLPVSGVIQHGDASQFGGNRYAYFPMAFGIAPIVCLALSRAPGGRKSLLLPVVVLFLSYSQASNRFLSTWSGDKALLDNCIALDPYDSVCNKFAGDYYGHYERNDAKARHFRQREYELIAAPGKDQERFLGTNDWLYLGYLHALQGEIPQACGVYKRAESLGLPARGPRNQAWNNWLMVKNNMLLCHLMTRGNNDEEMQVLSKELESFSDAAFNAKQRLRPRIARVVASTIESFSQYMDPTSDNYKQPFQSDFLH